jgi:hypothetical protein
VIRSGSTIVARFGQRGEAGDVREQEGRADWGHAQRPEISPTGVVPEWLAA